MLPILVAATTVFVAILIVASWLPPRLALRRHRARLRAISPRELAEEARRSADAAGIRKHFPEARLFDESQTWTSPTLAKALDELYAELSAEDQRNGEVGPGSFVYSFYDFGLASIREALEERVARGSGRAV